MSPWHINVDVEEGKEWGREGERDKEGEAERGEESEREAEIRRSMIVYSNLTITKHKPSLYRI